MRQIYSIALAALLPFAGIASAADELIVYTVLESDPYRAPAKRLKDVKVWGTVLEGEVYPVKR